MRKRYKIKKAKGNLMSVKMLALCCLVGSGVFTMNYISHKNYLTTQQNYTYTINKSGQQIFFDTNMLTGNSNSQKYLDDVIANQSNLINNLGFLDEKDSSILSIVNTNNLSEEDMKQLKTNVNQLNQLANDLNNIRDNFLSLSDDKKALPSLISSMHSSISAMQKNNFYNQDAKNLFNELNSLIDNIKIFNQGSLFYSSSDILKYQLVWINNLNTISNNLNNTLNMYMGTSVSSDLSDLNDKVKSLSNITNDFIKINQFKNHYNEDQLSILNNTFNNTLSTLLEKQRNLINSNGTSFYIALALFLIAGLGICSTILSREVINNTGANKKDKKQLIRYKDSIKKLENLLKTVLVNKDKSLSKSAYEQSVLNNTTKDVTTFNLRTTIDKMISVFFHLVEHNKVSFEILDDQAKKINNKISEVEKQTTEIQILRKNREEDINKLLSQQTKSLSVINSLVFNSNSIMNQAEETSESISHIIKRMKDIREISQDISKRIKRMSESYQAIGENTDYVREFAKKIEVLALDVGINASSLSNSNEGRKFTIIAKEIQRLAKYSTKNANKIDDFMNIIKEDAKITVSEMETNTGHIVDGDNSINKINQLVNLILNNIVSVKSESEKLSHGLEVNKIGTQASKELMVAFQDFIQLTTYLMEDLKTQINVDLRNEVATSLNEINKKVLISSNNIE